MYEWLSDVPGFEVDLPKGAFYLFPRVSKLFGRELGGRVIRNSMDLSEFLLDKALVSVVPGVAFGMDDHIRISYASSQEELEEAVKRIKQAISDELQSAL